MLPTKSTIVIKLLTPVFVSSQKHNTAAPLVSSQKMLFLLCLLLITSTITAQTTTQNYVQTLTARDTISGALINELNNPQKVQTDVVYVDGLGRTVQAVMQGASPAGKDLIKMHTYDAFGRQDKDYLPFEASTASGAYQNNVGSGQQGFYANPPVGVASNSYPYSQTLFESSPLNRPLETSAPGTSWRSSVHGGTHTVDFAYRFNTASDQIRLITVDQSSSQLMTASTNYAANALRGILTSDEDGKQMLEFTDNAGKVVCKINAVGTADETYIYYVYDNRDLLTFIIPPQAIDEIGTNWNLLNDATFRDQWLFRYQYDHRNRMIEKQVPGAEKVEMVYDKRDRLVMTLDGNRRNVATALGTTSSGDVEYVESGTLIIENYQGKNYVRAPGAKIRFKKPEIHITKAQNFTARKATSAITNENQWRYTKYDLLNRPVMTGIMSSTLNREDLQAFIDANNNYDFSVAYIGDTNGDIHGYDDTSYPQASGTEVLTVTYYDNYDFVTDFTWGANYTYSNHHPNTIGLVTGSLTQLLDNNNNPAQARHLKSVTYYDNRLRPQAQMSENYFGQVDEVVTTYKNDVSSLVANMTTRHRKEATSTTVTETFDYDHRDRLSTHTHQINSNPPKTLASNTYNAIGQLIKKNLNHATTPTQSINYRYNERGWLTTINGGATTFDDPTTDQFGMELKYDNAPIPNYNGNIGQLLWKTKGGGAGLTTATQDYQYTYDHLNRLKSADYTGAGNFDVSNITYDKNGNILTLQRNIIDNLDYDYLGNQLSRVQDATNNTEGFKDVSSAVGTQEYSYDANGNMINDANKGITNIQYNYLNLPQQVTLSDNTKIQYTYDAAGIKHRKTVDDGSQETTTYAAGFHYKDNTLQFLQHAEGRTLYNNGSWQYEYNLTDHLGNVRVSVNESGEVIQRDGYYPFGLTFNSSANSPENLYKLTGNEEQKEWDVFDFNARMYDPALGRFNSIDPLCEVQESWNPYHYNYNNPIAFVDPTGLMPEETDKSGDCGSGDAECQKSQSSPFDLRDDFMRISSNGDKNGGGKKKKKRRRSIHDDGEEVPNGSTLASISKAGTGLNFNDQNATTVSNTVGILGIPISVLQQQGKWVGQLKSTGEYRVYSANFYGNQYVNKTGILRKIGSAGLTISLLTEATRIRSTSDLLPFGKNAAINVALFFAPPVFTVSYLMVTNRLAIKAAGNAIVNEAAKNPTFQRAIRQSKQPRSFTGINLDFLKNFGGGKK